MAAPKQEGGALVIPSFSGQKHAKAEQPNGELVIFSAPMANIPTTHLATIFFEGL